MMPGHGGGKPELQKVARLPAFLLRLSQFKKTLAIGVVLSIVMALFIWMLQLVAEYPGVERTFILPSWFTGSAESPVQPSPQHAQETLEKNELGQSGGYTVIRGTEVEINEREYKLEPNQIRIEVKSLPATITFVLHNQGRFSHDFEVKGHGIDAKAPKFGPGRTQEFEVTFGEPGEYEILCPLSNHAERGMRGTLVVKGEHDAR